MNKLSDKESKTLDLKPIGCVNRYRSHSSVGNLVVAARAVCSCPSHPVDWVNAKQSTT